MPFISFLAFVRSLAGYDQLLDEENGAARLGVIGATTLLGYTIGSLRGRLFKKIFYSSLGLAGSAALCFPEESNEILKEAKKEGKELYNIAVNFVNGGRRRKRYETVPYLIFSSFPAEPAVEKMEVKKLTTDKPE